MRSNGETHRNKHNNVLRFKLDKGVKGTVRHFAWRLEFKIRYFRASHTTLTNHDFAASNVDFNVV